MHLKTEPLMNKSRRFSQQPLFLPKCAKIILEKEHKAMVEEEVFSMKISPKVTSLREAVNEIIRVK